jgi:hypothetical protein
MIRVAQGEAKQEFQKDCELIHGYQKDGHTHNCACRLVWGDGECECNKQGFIPGRASRIIEALRSDNEQ